MKFLKQTFLLAGFALIALSSQGQTIYFNNLYDDAYNLPNNGNNIIIKDGKYLIGGNGNYFCDSSTIDLFSIDINGNLEWIKTYNYSNAYYQSSYLINTPDSGHAFFTTNQQFCLWPTSSSINLLKLDVNGDSLWSKSIGWGDVQDIKLTNDNGFIIAGSNFYNDGVNIWSDFLLVKLDDLGNVLWDSTYGDTVKLESAASVEFTSDGGNILFGTVLDSMNAVSQDLYFVKVDSIGNFQWDKRISSSGSVSIYGSLQSGDGNYIVYGNIVLDSVNDRQGYISKIDTAGNIIWEKYYGGTDFESIYKIRELPDANLISAGAEWINPNKSNALLTKFNASGDDLWTKVFATQDSTVNRFNDIQLTQDGGFIITGESNGDMWLVKVDSTGCEIPNCTVGKDDEIRSEQLNFKVHPNPAKNLVFITLKTNREISINVYNSLGELIDLSVNQNAQNTAYEIDFFNHPAGIYFIKIQMGKQVVTDKIVLIK